MGLNQNYKFILTHCKRSEPSSDPRERSEGARESSHPATASRTKAPAFFGVSVNREAIPRRITHT